MICRYCGKQIRDDSEFCPCCGKPLGKPEKPDASIKDDNEETPVPVTMSVAQNEKRNKKMGKKRFCRICGTEINCKTKQCPNCGKQYFRWKWSHLFLTLSHLVLCVALVLSANSLHQAEIRAEKEQKLRLAAEQKYETADFTNRPTVTDGWVITYNNICHTKCCVALDHALKEINVAKVFHVDTVREEVEAKREETKLEKLGFTAKRIALSEGYKLCSECFKAEYAEE